MPRALNWIVWSAIAALLAGSVALWLERGNAMLLDLSSGLATLLCL
jgi:hypothetical protein